MKKMLSVITILAMLGVTSLWAMRGEEKGRTYNRDAQKRSGHAKWARAYGMDSDGNLSTYASIEVDVDFKWGIVYTAEGSVYGDGSTGSYALYASVPIFSDSASGIVRGDTYRYVNARLYTVGRNINAEDRLSRCSADTKIDIIGHRSHAKAFKFEKKGES